ncbi:MAG: serine--tRNA ligase [Chloroflexaceae bacterium]|nr:serine--tRNA ligase [Chloroflexaceae bacterium]
MIDPNLLIHDFDATVQRLARKKTDLEFLNRTRFLLLERRNMQQQLDEKRATMNKSSKEIGGLLQSGQTEAAEERKATVAMLKEEIAALEEQVRKAEEQVDYFLLRIPNLPADDCPDGDGEADNVIVRTHNYNEADYRDRSYRPHWDVAGDLGIYDGDRASKISGSMFSLLRGEGARLLRALVHFGLAINADTYEEIAPPHFVRTDTFTATGHLPKFEVEAYKLRDDDLWAIPTGEVPLMSLHRDEILDEDDLPRRYMAYTVCFRREAGSAGKDTRGLQRLHEFQKVELVKVCTPEQAPAEYAALLADAERPLQLLGLPYRVVDLCTADLTFSSARVHDLEVYAPGIDRWLEVSSVGVFTDFQTRRGNIRYRPKGSKKVAFTHAMNGSGLATPRVWAAVIEHGQQADGSVKIPEPLVPFMGTDVIRPKT